MEVRMKFSNLLSLFRCLSLLAILGTGGLLAQQDPGPRGGTPGASGPFPALNTNEQSLFNNALDHFMELNSVDRSVPGEQSIGLGPTFNGNSCALWHAEPAIGGRGPATLRRLEPV